MRNKIKKIGIGLGAIAILIGGRVAFSEPGSQSDPLVTMGYVDKKIEQIQYYIDTKISGNVGSNSSNEFIVVEVPKGQAIILGGGAEAILRSGEAIAISRIENGIDNGLANVTTGVDLGMDEPITLNHLLLTPRNDGRGARALRNSMFLVRGTYEIR